MKRKCRFCNKWHMDLDCPSKPASYSLSAASHDQWNSSDDADHGINSKISLTLISSYYKSLHICRPARQPPMDQPSSSLHDDNSTLNDEASKRQEDIVTHETDVAEGNLSSTNVQETYERGNGSTAPQNLFELSNAAVELFRKHYLSHALRGELPMRCRRLQSISIKAKQAERRSCAGDF
jgi:hypothetical protein